MWQINFNPFLMLFIAIVSIVVLIAFIVLITIRIRLRHNRNGKTGKKMNLASFFHTMVILKKNISF